MKFKRSGQHLLPIKHFLRSTHCHNLVDLHQFAKATKICWVKWHFWKWSELLRENNQSLHFPGKGVIIFNHLNSRYHVLPYLMPSFTEEKKQTDWGPPCVTNKGWLSLGLLDPRSVHQVQAKCLTIMLKRKAKISPYVESITWNPAHTPQCTNEGLREDTAVPREAGGPLHRGTLSSSLGQRGFFTQQSCKREEVL